MFERITDNRKVLKDTGLKQGRLMPLREGLRLEFDRSRDFNWSRYSTDEKNVRMDEYLKKTYEK